MTWLPDWSGQACLIVGSGESTRRDIVESFRGHARVIVINTSFQLAPWADVLYGADERWWEHHKEAIAFTGLKVTSQKNTKSPPEVHRLDVTIDTHKILVHRDGVVGDGGFSGFQALNFAIQCGAKRIPLLGFDLCGTHWHGEHPSPLIRQTRQRTYDKWRERLDAQGGRIKSLGVDVVNLSDVSALRNYPKMSPAEFLGEPLRAVA